MVEREAPDSRVPSESHGGALYFAQSVLGRFAIARSLPLTIAASICIQVVNLGSGVVLARALGPGGRGDLAIAMLWPVVIGGLGGLGVAEAVVYLAGREGDRFTEVLNSSLVLAIVQGVGLVSVGLVIVPHILAGKASALVSACLLYLWAIPIGLFANYLLSVLQGRLLLGPFNLARAAIHIFYTLFLVGLWTVHAVTLLSAVWASVLGTVASLLLAGWFVVKRTHFRPHITFAFVRPLLSYGSKLQVGNIANLLVQRADLLALTLMAPSAALGTYVVASAIGAGASLVPTAASMVLFPLFSSRGREALPHGVARFALVAGVSTIVAGPVLAVLLPWTLPFLFGQVYEPAKSISGILVAAYLVRGWNQMLGSILRGAGRPLLASAGEVGGLVVMAALLAYLVPEMGNLGAALSVLVGATSMFLWVAIQTFQVSGLTLGRMVAYWSADLAASIRIIHHSRTA